MKHVDTVFECDRCRVKSAGSTPPFWWVTLSYVAHQPNGNMPSVEWHLCAPCEKAFADFLFQVAGSAGSTTEISGG